MAEKIVIAELDIDTKSLIDDTAKLKKELIELRKSSSDVQKEIKKQGTVTEEQSKKLVENEKAIKKTNTAYQQNIKVLNATDQATEELNKELGKSVKTQNEAEQQNKKLLAIRKNLNVSTKEGARQAEQINKKVDENNKFVNENNSALEKQKVNIGNYSSALDKVIPGLGGLANGIQSSTKAAITFIATPLGAILGAIGVAVGSLTAFFKGSEEGQDSFNKISKVVGVTLGNLKDVVISFGKFLFEAFSKPQETIKSIGDFIKNQVTVRFQGFVQIFTAGGDVIKNTALGIAKSIQGIFSEEAREEAKVFFKEAKEGLKEVADGFVKVNTGFSTEQIVNGVKSITSSVKELTSEIDKEIQAQQRLADLEARLNKADRAFLVEKAKREVEIAEILREAREAENKGSIENIENIQKAIEVQDKLSNQQIALAEQRFKIAQEEASFAENTREDNDALAQQEADLILLRKANADRQRSLLRELDKANSDFAKSQAQLLAEQAKIEKKASDEAVANATLRAETVKQARLQELEAVEGTNEALISSQKNLLEEEKRLREEAVNASVLSEEEKLIQLQEIDAEYKEQNILLEQEFQSRLFEQEIEALEANNASKFDIQKKQLDREFDLKVENAKKNIKNEEVLKKELTRIEGKYNKDRQEIDKLANTEITKERLALTKNITTLLGENTKASKIAGIATGLINTAQGVTEVFKSPSILPEPIGTIAKIANAAVITKAGLKQVSQIRSLEQGGIMEAQGARHSSGGIELALNGRPVAEIEGGEAIQVHSRKDTAILKSRLGGLPPKFETGGTIFTGSDAVSLQTNGETSAIANTIIEGFENLPSPVVSVEEISEGFKSVDVLDIN
jgi:hypothetical protein